MRILRFDEPDFASRMLALQRTASPSPEVVATVAGILADIRQRGDAALIDYTRRFDGAALSADTLRIADVEIEASAAQAAPEVRGAVEAAHRNVSEFARRGLRQPWQATNAEGADVGERFDPLGRVGIYVPAGTAPLASTVLMTVTLAKVAGVPEIVVATPVAGTGALNPAVALALQTAGATEVYRVGGAQAVAALAYGTETIRSVAKIFGPGNPWVVEAKRQVFGVVGVDLLPGPSEILVLADETANAAWIAADLLAQAEHGHGSSVALVTTSARLLEEVSREVDRQAATLLRGSHLRGVLEEDTFLVLVPDLVAAVEVANDFAPEHLSLVVRNDEEIAPKLRTAGAIFLGGYSPVAAGDFLAGPSHELPTGGAGKAFPGLTVDQFQRRTSLVRYNAAALKASCPFIRAFSEIEGLDAHGQSATIRFLDPST